MYVRVFASASKINSHALHFKIVYNCCNAAQILFLSYYFCIFREVGITFEPKSYPQI